MDESQIKRLPPEACQGWNRLAWDYLARPKGRAKLLSDLFFELGHHPAKLVPDLGRALFSAFAVACWPKALARAAECGARPARGLLRSMAQIPGDPPLESWIACAKTLVEISPRQLNERGGEGASPLLLALIAFGGGLAQGEDRALALLDMGADPNAELPQGATCLDLALRAGGLRASLRLLDLGARRGSELPMLADAAGSPSPELVAALIARGEDPEAVIEPVPGGRRLGILSWARKVQRRREAEGQPASGVVEVLAAAVEARSIARSSRAPKCAPRARPRSL